MEAKKASEEDLARGPLQAILLADGLSSKKLEPITLECPKLVLPLVNTPMIDYTLAWLESADVEEVFVMCCSHSKQVINYLDKSKWVNQPKPNFSVRIIECGTSASDALRLMYERKVIEDDFILVSGDTVSNMKLTQALEEHKERRREDKSAMMTMVIKQSEEDKEEEIVMGIDPTTQELVYYEDKDAAGVDFLKVDKSSLSVNSCLSLHNDKQDCYIDICSPQVLSLFTQDNNSGDVRRGFVKGLLDNGMEGFKIFTHEILHSTGYYVVRVDGFRSYGSISKDIIQRQFSATKLSYVIGEGTVIGSNTEMSDSVVGDGCRIGSNVGIEGCYIWNKVVIEDGCKLSHAILCDGVVVGSGAVLKPGVVLSYGVVVGPGTVVPRYSKVSVLAPPCAHNKLVGNGFIWSTSEEDSVAPPPNYCTIPVLPAPEPVELENGVCGYKWLPTTIPSYSKQQDSAEQQDRSNGWSTMCVEGEEWSFPEPIPLPPEFAAAQRDSDSLDELFRNEVEATFTWAIQVKGGVDYVVHELHPIRANLNISQHKCAVALLCSMMKLALDNSSTNSGNDLVKETHDVISEWGGILKPFLMGGLDAEVGLISSFEQMCLDSELYAPLFHHVLRALCDKDIIQDDAILNWAHQKQHAHDESDRLFLNQSQMLLQSLQDKDKIEDFKVILD